MAYTCFPCRRPFGSQQALQQHLDSPAHSFDCDECDRRFGSQQALQQHLDSPAHNFDCDECDRRFGSQQALQQHLDSPAHNFDCDECDRRFGSLPALQQHLNSLAHGTITTNEYNGIPRSTVDSVFKAALNLRFKKPTVNDILRRTDTDLEHSIVSSIIAAALRLLPVDDSPSGIALRQEQHRIKAAEAKKAEDDFCRVIKQCGLKFVRESDQHNEASTPDVRFQNPTIILGHTCFWLEFKNYFGFKANPFVAPKNKRQFRRYASQIGPGAVIYKLGFETSHLNIDGVVAFREKEVLHALKSMFAK